MRGRVQDAGGRGIQSNFPPLLSAPNTLRFCEQRERGLSFYKPNNRIE